MLFGDVADRDCIKRYSLVKHGDIYLSKAKGYWDDGQLVGTHVLIYRVLIGDLWMHTACD